jgi:acetylornithine deacetylase
VPDRCEFFVDIRTHAGVSHKDAANAVAAALESEVTVHSSRYEAVATPSSETIVKAALLAAGKVEPVDSVTTSDWAFLKGLPAVKAGPGDTQRSHQPNEYLLLSELEAGASFYSKLVQTYFTLAAKEVAHV